MKAFLKKEWLLAIRQLHQLFQPLFFILILVIVFPLAIGVEEELLNKVSAGIIWIAVLLSILLSSEYYYKSDFEDGSLEQLYLSGHSMLLLIFSKLLIQFVIQIVPILVALPLLGVFYGMHWDMEGQLALTLLIGSPTLLLFAMLGSVVTLASARGGLLLILLIFPLYIPTLVFALSAMSAYIEGFSNIGQLSILGALLMVTVVVVPFAIAEVIRLSLGEE